MYTNENTIKLFDANNNFVADFDKKIEEIEISIHGPKYYDIDEEITNTNEIPVQKDEIVVKQIKEKKQGKVTIVDFLPVIFIILIFGIVLFAGYYFLNNFDIASMFK
jgi:hypothetical protein